KGIADGQRANLIKEPRLIEQCAKKHDHVTEGLGDLSEEKGSVEKMARKGCGDVAENIQRSDDKERVVVDGSRLGVLVQTPAERKCRGKKQHRGKQVPGTRKQTSRMRTWSGRRCQECRARGVGAKRHHQQRYRDFLARLPRSWRVAFDRKRRQQQN